MYQTVDLGPDSLLWRWAGDMRIGFLGGTIGLLQLMHPAIGAGVTQHSDFFADPFDRVFRSLPNILGVVYDGQHAETTGRTVRDFHRDIKGTDATGRVYHALDPATYWWAHATFQFMAEQVVDRFDAHRLTAREREQLYLEGVEWYRRYGVSARAVPPDYAAYRAEWDRVRSEELELNPAVEWVLESLHAGRRLPGPSLPAAGRALLRFGPARRLGMHGVRVVTIGGLPRTVRKRFDIPWTWQDAIELSLLESTIRRTWPLVPNSMRWHPRARGGMATGARSSALLRRSHGSKARTLELAPIVAGLAGPPDDEIGTAVLDAAAGLLIAHGLRRWSVDDVADRVCIGRTSVYRKFGGRDEIVHAVLARELRETFALIGAAASRQATLEDKLVAGALAGLRALDGSVVDGVLRSDPATLLPFLTTQAGPLLDIARTILAPQILAAGVADNAAHAAEIAEAAARLGLSFILTRHTVFPVDERGLATSVRRLLRPLLS